MEETRMSFLLKIAQGSLKSSFFYTSRGEATGEAAKFGAQQCCGRLGIADRSRESKQQTMTIRLWETAWDGFGSPQPQLLWSWLHFALLKH